MKPFLDTNVVVYAFLDDPRQERAQEALERGGTISAQVLNEFASVSRTKHRRSWGDIRSAVEILTMQIGTVLPLTSTTHGAALVIAAQHQISFYDALIVASALEGRCDTLLTEDSQSGYRFGTLTVRNPFV